MAPWQAGVIVGAAILLTNARTGSTFGLDGLGGPSAYLAIVAAVGAPAASAPVPVPPAPPGQGRRRHPAAVHGRRPSGPPGTIPWKEATGCRT